MLHERRQCSSRVVKIIASVLARTLFQLPLSHPFPILTSTQEVHIAKLKTSKTCKRAAIYECKHSDSLTDT